MTNTNQRYLLFVEPYRMYFYGMQMEQPYPIDLPVAAVRDLEVLNRDQVYSVVDAFLTSNGVTGGNIVMVLSQALLFEKQIVQDLSDEARRTAVIKDYVDNVPFEQTAYISYPIQTGIGVMATNEELFGAIKKAFDRKHVSVSLILPVRAFGDVQVSQQTGPDAQTAVFFLQNADQLKQFAFHAAAPVVVNKPQESAHKLKITNGPSKKLPIYLSIFGFLILVMIIMIVVTNQPAADKPVNTNAVASEPPAAALSAPTTAPEGSSSAQLNRATIRVQIKAPAVQSARVEQIVSGLTAAGYTTVDVLDSPAAAATTVFLDRSKLTADQRAAVSAELKTYVTEFAAQEVDQGEYAVVVAVGPE